MPQSTFNECPLWLELMIDDVKPMSFKIICNNVSGRQWKRWAIRHFLYGHWRCIFRFSAVQTGKNTRKEIVIHGDRIIRCVFVCATLRHFIFILVRFYSSQKDLWLVRSERNRMEFNSNRWNRAHWIVSKYWSRIFLWLFKISPICLGYVVANEPLD